MEKTKVIRHKDLIPGVTPEKVYDALVNARKHAEFTGAPATGVGRAGGKFTAWGDYISGKHVELVKGEKIVQEWVTSEWPEGQPPSILTWTMKSKKAGTELTLHQKGVPVSQADRYVQGWIDFYYVPLKKYFEA